MTQGINLVAKFLENIARGYRPSHLYRGHANESWDIRPSAFREKRHGIVAKEQLIRWKAMSSRVANPRPRNDFEWLVLAQHYGIPTGLLDWTTNPLVALFFACQRIDSNVTGCVIRFPRENFQVFNSPETVDVFKDGRTRPGLVDATGMNARTLAQDSAMSLHSKELPDLIPEASNIFRVRHESKSLILHALKKFGFSAERIYFDVAVAAREFNEELEIDAILGSEW